MPTITQDEVITNKHKRNYIQFGGARPGNVARYAGQDAQYLAIEGVSLHETGGIDPVWVPDPHRIGSYRMVARKLSAPDLASATLKMLEKHGSIPRQLQRIGCQFNLYEATGQCADLSDFLGGWTDYVLIYSGALVTDKDLGTRSAWDADDMIEDSLSLVLADAYPMGSLAFGEQAAAQIDREVADVVYGSNLKCGDCGPADDGTNWIYAVTKSSGAGSPGIPAEVIYSINGGASWNEVNIAGIGATVDPAAIDIVGTRLVVVVNSELAYYWADINPNTGVPGAFTKVTSGFVAAKGPNDIYVLSPREVFFCGDGGYVYKSTDITAGVSVINAAATTTSSLLRIHGKDETIVCVGAASTCIKSVNRGATFAVTTTNPSGIPTNVQALAVLDAKRYWAGTALGRIAYTLDGGETWTQPAFDSAGTGQVRDILTASDECLFFSHDTTTPTARVFASWDGGQTWTRTSPRLLNWPTFNRANRLAFPAVDAGVAVNNLAVAGLSGGGTDGVLYLGIASKL